MKVRLIWWVVGFFCGVGATVVAWVGDTWIVLRWNRKVEDPREPSRWQHAG